MYKQTIIKKIWIDLLPLKTPHTITTRLVGWFMVFNSTFNNISVISWRSFLLV